MNNTNDKLRLIEKEKRHKVYTDVNNETNNDIDNRLEEISESIIEDHVKNENNKAKILPQYIATVCATLAALSAGIVLGWTSPISLDLQHGNYNNISINDNEMGWIGSFVTVGAMLTCLPYGIVCDAIGRRGGLLILIIPYSVGWSFIIWAKSLVMLYIGRFITGMAAGACCVAAPLYVNEITTKEIRGSLGSYFQLMVTVGILCSYLLGKFITLFNYTVSCAMFPLLFFFLFAFQPESPFYSIKKGNYDAAQNALVTLRGSSYNVQEEINFIKLNLEEGNRDNVSVFVALKQKPNLKAYVIALTLMFFQQFSGINAIIFYTSDIFALSHSTFDPKTGAILVGTFQVIATFISSLIVDKLGRKILLICSTFVMAVSIIFLGLFFTIKDRQIVSKELLNSLSFLPLILLSLYIIMFSIGLGPIPWTISGEIFKTNMKSFAAASAGTFNWFLAFLITKFFLSLKTIIGNDILFYIFGLICFCGSLFVYMFVPETKGKTIEEIQEELN